MAVDVRVTNDNELVIKNGDLDYGLADDDNVRFLLLNEKGNLKEFPETGVGIRDFLLEETPGNLVPSIRNEVTADGGNITDIGILGDNLTVKASYEG